jgi:serine/threonine protein kinase
MDRYHIYEAIGRGKHSVVYKGRRKKTIQYYAIKSVEKSQRPRVLQEVQVLRSVSHDLVLKFHAWYETQNHLWLVLEYCVGGDLLTILRQVAHHTPRERGGRRVLRASVSVCASVLTHRAPGKGAAAVGMGGRGGAP